MSEVAAPAAISRLLSDERLTQRAVGGDERAFGAIFRRYHQPLYRFCLAIVGNPEDAQDALQNTMMKVLRALPGEERQIDLKPWLYRIAHNEAIDLLRRRRQTRPLDVEHAAPGYGLAEDAETRERLRRLLADLRELPERQRDVLVMRELAGLDFDEVSSALGTSHAVARQTLYEARLSLRQMEEGREMGCDSVTKALSDGDGRVTRRRDVRAHLRSCSDCRRFRDEIKGRRQDLAALSPLPAAAAAGMLQGMVGGSGAASGGGLAAALGGGAAKTIATSAAVKGVATVAVVAAVGVTAADRSGVIHLGLSGEGGSKPAQEAPSGSGAGGAAAGVGPAHRPADGASTGADNAHLGNGKAGPAGQSAAGLDSGKGHSGPTEHSQGHEHGQSGLHAPSAPSEHPIGHEKETPEAASGEQGTSSEQGTSGAQGAGAERKPEAPASNGGGKKSEPEEAPAQPTKAPQPEKAPPPKGPPENPPQGAAPKGPPQAQQPQPPAKATEGSDAAPASPGEAGKAKAAEHKP
ncbi:MAG TPA: sigma-70 family RNA polymerase sigma factor [Sphingomicrobium sp.]|nr:sigma-70 family RNA polymerase sigma factor [Sphingomicrobium sp.]